MLFDPERRWGPQGICTWEDRGLFFAEGGQPHRTPSKKAQARWDQAKEICAMCPVMEKCRRDSLGEEYGVFGGYDEHQRFLIRKKLPQRARNWPEERRLAWGKALAEMRDGGVTLRTTFTQTGFSTQLILRLIEEWEVHKASQPVAEITELPLPDLPRRQVDFPVKVGRRHAWVRHRGVVSDAFYRGQTPDGAWIYVTTYAGRGNVRKWIKAEDVHLYHPQPVVILHRREEQSRAREPDPSASEPLIA